MMLLSARIKLYIIVSNNYNDQCKHQINHANQPQFDKIKVTDGLVTPGASASAAMILTDFSLCCSIFSLEGVTSTVECPYNAVQCKMILHTILWLLWQNLNRDLYSPQTPHIPPSHRGGLWGVHFEEFGGNSPHYNSFTLQFDCRDGLRQSSSHIPAPIPWYLRTRL